MWEQRIGVGRLLRAWDPMLDDTIRLAQASGLIVQQQNGRQTLSETGERLIEAIRQGGNAMLMEQRLLASFGRLTESGMWDRLGRLQSSARTKEP